jgi:hypothetical protein
MSVEARAEGKGESDKRSCPGVKDGTGVRLVVPFALALLQFDQELEIDLHDELKVAKDLCRREARKGRESSGAASMM